MEYRIHEIIYKHKKKVCEIKFTHLLMIKKNTWIGEAVVLTQNWVSTIKSHK